MNRLVQLVAGVKRSKRSVNYSPGMGEDRCCNCVHYSAGTCELVAGPIDPTYWCELFERRRA